MGATAARSEGMHGTVRPHPAGVKNGHEIEGRVLLDTASQVNVINVISRVMFAKLQANYPLNTLINHRKCSAVLADQVVAHAVDTTEPLNVTAASRVEGPLHLSRIVFTILEGGEVLLLLGHATTVAN